MPKKITDLAVGGQAVIEGVMMRDAAKDSNCRSPSKRGDRGGDASRHLHP